MAVDTQQKRYSLLKLLTPGGDIDYSDRMTCLGLYGGLGGPASYEVTVWSGALFGDLGKSAGSEWGVGVADEAKFGDAAAAAAEFQAALADEAKFGDAAGNVAEFQVALADEAKFGDSPFRGGFYEVTIADEAKFGDLLDIIHHMTPAVADEVKFGDLVKGNATWQVVIADESKFGDAALANSVLEALAADGALFGDLSGHPTMHYAALVADEVRFGEYGIGAAGQEITDGIKFGDRVTVILARMATASDEVKFGEYGSALPIGYATVTFTSAGPRIILSGARPTITFTHA